MVHEWIEGEESKMDMGLRDKVVVVTGATANIGRATAVAFAAEGARVVVSGRDAEAGAAVVAEAEASGAAQAVWIAADLRDPEAVSTLAQRVLSELGGIDVLVNNAGGNATFGAFVESDPESWAYDIEINLHGVIRMTRAFLPHMVAQKSGWIVNIGSTAGTIGDPFVASYSAAKAGVHGFTKVLASEVGVANVTVNAIAPYATVPTDPDEAMSTGSRSHPEGLFNTMSTDEAQAAMSIFRTGALPRPTARSGEIAAAAVYLASSHAAFVTGEILHVDGGVRLAWSHPEIRAAMANMQGTEMPR